MDKNSLIKLLVKEISQEIKKEIRFIIKEEFDKLSSSNANNFVNKDRVSNPIQTKENYTQKSYTSIDSLLFGTSPFNSSDMEYGPSVTTENVDVFNSYKNEPVVDMDGKVVLPSSEGGNLMSKLLSRNYTPVLKKAEKIK
jgi:hypothetical protein